MLGGVADSNAAAEGGSTAGGRNGLARFGLK